MTLPLPEKVDRDEKLARVICDSSKPKKYEKTAFRYDEKESRFLVNTGKFLSHNNPTELSVNRVSTLSLDEAHKLGLAHKDEYQPDSTYHGFAQITADICFEKKCAVKKDDMNGTKPYHANIIYPIRQGKEEDQSIAAFLAYRAHFVKYQKGQGH